jgi:PAS domain S-box-containing protein
MLNPLRLLIVEDSESDASLLVRLFTRADYQVTSQRVETRDSLQAALAQDAWDCVIADHNMPDLDAFSALETLQSSGLDIPFIVASGSIGEETAVALMKSGAADYVMKDKMTRLTAVVERELRDAAARRERRQAIASLRANEEKYRRLFDLESDALFLIERDSGRILEANSGATALYGYSHDEWLTMRNVDVSVEPDDTTAATRTAMTNIPVRWHRKKDGTVFPVDIRATHFGWQGRPVHLAAIRDITERVRAQEALRAERDRAESYLRIAGVILVALDAQGKITLINRRGCEVLGYNEDELLGRDWFDTCLPPADRQAVRASFDHLIAGDDAAMADFVNNVITKAGELRLVSWRNNLLRDADGGPLGTLSSGEDITERRRAEKALQESEARLRDITFSMADWVWEVNETGVYTYSSQKGSDLFGRPSENIIGKTPFEFMPPDEAKRVAAIFSGITANKAPIRDLENWNITKNGERRCLLTNGVPILDEEGHLKGYRGVDKDITERKRAEEALRDSNALLHRTLAGLDEAVLVVNADTRQILTCNQSAERVFGYRPEELVGETTRVLHVSQESFQDFAKTRFSATGLDGISHMEYQMRRKDGAVFWSENTVADLKGEPGSPRLVVSVVRDITERKAAEQTQVRLVAMLDATPGFVGFADAKDTRIRYINPSGRKMVGVHAQEDVTQLKIADVHPEWTNKMFRDEILPTAIRDGMWTGECAFLNRDGHEIPVVMALLAHKSPSGEVERFSTISMDITKRKQAEDVIRASLREKELLLKEIHHRVKNNLQIIASLLTLQAQSVRDPVALEVLQDSQNRIRAMSLIHAKLYESSDLVRVDFGAFARDLGTILLRAYAPNPSAIHLRVSAGQADLDVDTLVPCSLIVNELLANAIKHAFPSGASGTVTIALTHQDGAYTLRVADDGIGFPDALDFRHTKSLGLRLVNMLVEQLDGTIELLNKGGAEFTIRFLRSVSA